jgi:hypothetical protein
MTLTGLRKSSLEWIGSGLKALVAKIGMRERPVVHLETLR